MKFEDRILGLCAMYRIWGLRGLMAYLKQTNK